MYIFTTLGNAHKNVWEQIGDNSPALFNSKYEIKSIKRINEEINLNKRVLAIGLYDPYYGRNRSQQYEPAQHDHSSLLLIKKVEHFPNQKYDIRILFKLLLKLPPDETRNIHTLKPNSTPLISFVDDNIFSRLIKLDDFINLDNEFK